MAAEAFVDYWNMSYSRMKVPKQGWPPAIRHCLSAVGLLPEEAGLGQQEEKLALEPAFVASIPIPRTPIAARFTTPAVLKREAFAIQSPQRPQKMSGPFPTIPSSPVSPLLRRSSDFAERRMPLSSIQLCQSPSKRRRLGVDHNENDEKENVEVVPVVDLIAAMTPGGGKKRRHGEVEDEAEEQNLKSNPSAKKLKSSMRPRTRSASKKASRHASPACSVASSNESEDDRRWVEAMLTGLVPFPVTETHDDACDAPVLPQRKRHIRTVNLKHSRFCGVVVPSRKSERTTSLDGPSSSKMLDLKRPIKRSMSIPESMLTSKTGKRKHRESDADDDSPDLYDLVGSDPLPALQLPLLPPPVRLLRKAYSLPPLDSDTSTSSLSSSDDDPYIGQVTPHHLISPTLQRRVNVAGDLLTSKSRKIVEFGERFGDVMMMPGSDDSITTSESETESPTKEAVTRQMVRMRNASDQSIKGRL